MKKSLFGYGKTTKAIAQTLAQKMGTFSIYDDSFKEKSLDAFGNELLPVSAFEPAKKVSLNTQVRAFPLRINSLKKRGIYKASMIFSTILCLKAYG